MKTYPNFIFAFALFLSTPSFAQNEFPHNPSSFENDPYLYCTSCAGSIWNNVENVNETDNQYATLSLAPYLNCYQGTCYWSRYLACYDFGFSIPSNAIITGIQMNITGFSGMSSSVLDCTIVIRRNASSVAGTNMAKLSPWPTTPEIRSYGGEAELWGYTWTPADINSSDFGVYIKLYNPTTLSPSVNIDHVSMTVTYQVPTGTLSQTSSPHPFRLAVNPSNQSMNMILEITSEINTVQFYIYDMLGNECFASVVEGASGGTFTEKVNTSNFKPGIYICQAVIGDKVYNEKILIGN